MDVNNNRKQGEIQMKNTTLDLQGLMGAINMIKDLGTNNDGKNAGNEQHGGLGDFAGLGDIISTLTGAGDAGEPGSNGLEELQSILIDALKGGLQESKESDEKDTQDTKNHEEVEEAYKAMKESLLKEDVVEEGCTSNCDDCVGNSSCEGTEDDVYGLTNGEKYGLELDATVDRYKEHYLFSKLVKGFTEHNNVLIVGPPESGKTELLKDLLAIATTENRFNNSYGAVDGIETKDDIQRVSNLIGNGDTVIATMQANTIGAAINMLGHISKGIYENKFNIVVQVGGNKANGGRINVRRIRNVMILG